MVARIAVLQWGRTGGGPRFAWEIAKALQSAGGLSGVSFASNGDLAREFSQISAPKWSISTFRSAFGAVARLPVLFVSIVRMRRFLRATRTGTVLIAMEQLWSSFATPALRSKRWEVATVIHDAHMHPGDSNAAERALRWWGRLFSDRFVVLSESVESELRSLGSRKPITRTVHAAFEAPPVMPRSGPSVPAVIGFFGRLSEYKGLANGYRAVQLLRTSGQLVEFHVAGNGDLGSVPSMLHPLDSQRLEWIPDDEVPGVIGSFDILLLPYIEASQSGVIAYAMSLGVPTVVTPVGGLAEQAQGSGVALVAAGTDPESIAAALARLLGDAALYESLSATGIARAREEYGWARVATDLVEAMPARGSAHDTSEAAVP